MMRVIFLLLVSSIALQSKSQIWNNYLQKRFKSYGIWADSVLLVPNDTSLNKTGFAIKGYTAYIGDGVKWTAITGGSSVVDSLVFATWRRLYKVNDSMKVVYSNLYGFNIGNTNLRLTGNRVLSGGAGSGNGYEFTFDSTGKVSFQNKGGTKYFEASSDGELKVSNALNESFKIYNTGEALFQSSNTAESDMPTRVTLSAQDDTATFKIWESTRLQLEKVNPNNGSPYKPLVKNVATGIVEYVDAVIIDTTEIATKAYVNYKDYMQQTFIDYRKLDADSSGWTGYTSRARTQQIVDSMKAKDLIRDDTLTSHNTRMLANQNAINSLDALVVKLGGSQTITGAKTVTNNFKIKDDNGTAISDTKLVLENARTATFSDTIAVAPYILFSSKSYVGDFGAYNPPYSSVSSTMQWRIRQSLYPAGQYAGQDNRLYFDYKNGDAGSWISAVSISKDGVQGNITGIDQMTLGNYSGNRGKITFKNVGGYTAGYIEAAGNVLRVGDGSANGRIEFFNGVVYYGGSATSTGSQLSANGWAFAKNANSTFTASALLHLDKNRSTAGNAPIKFTLAGAALLTTPERGALEAMPYRLHFTDSSNQRNTLAYLSDVYKTPMNVADSNYTVVGNEIIIGFTGLTADRACTLPNPASHVGKSLTLFAKGMNNYDLNFSSSYKPKNLNDAIITSVKDDLPKHGIDIGSAIEGVSMKLVSFNNEWVILNYFTHYK